MTERALRALISALLILAAVLFAIGVAIERHDVRTETAQPRGETPRPLFLADADQGNEAGVGTSQTNPERSRSRPPEHSGNENAGEKSRERRKEPRHESATQIARERGGERILGVNPDSTVLVTLAVAASLVLALALWLVSGIGPPLAIAAFAAGATVFDALEVAHQINESRTNLIVIAGVVALLHLAAAANALLLIRRRAPRAAARAHELSGA